MKFVKSKEIKEKDKDFNEIINQSIFRQFEHLNFNLDIIRNSIFNIVLSKNYILEMENNKKISDRINKLFDLSKTLDLELTEIIKELNIKFGERSS